MSQSLNGTKKSKRNVDLVVISDVHLGTYGCQARELVNYMRSIMPKVVVLNGDILDIWQFKKSYWPKSHMLVIKQIINWMSKGIEIHYITGNHDEMLRKFNGFSLGSFSVKNKLVLELNGKKVWFFHGDVFDVTMQYSKWIAKLGGIGYDFLIKINSLVNRISQMMGKGRISLSKKVKNKVKGAVKFINDFERVATDIAIDNQYDFVVCGHIHHPEIKKYTNKKGEVIYLNSGDWIENLSALEYHNNTWRIHQYEDLHFINTTYDDIDPVEKSTDELFQEMLDEFNILKSKD